MATMSKPLPLVVRPIEDPAQTVVPDAKLVVYLTDLLSEWKNHRRAAIEDTWERAYKNFNGVFDDDYLDTKTKANKAWRSKAFYPLTEQKVTGAEAQLQDILFKGGRFPYDIKNSPLPDDPTMAPMVQQAADPELPVPQEQPEGIRVRGTPAPQTIEQKAMNLDQLEVRMKNMKKRIDDQIAEADAASVGLRSLFDGALYGTAFLEAPKVIRKKRYHWKKKGKSFEKKELYEDVPTVVNLDPWDCWPDPECGGVVANGLGFFHRESMSLAGLQELFHLVFPSEETVSADAESEEYEYDYRKTDFKKLLAELAQKGRAKKGYDKSDGPDDTKNSDAANRPYDVLTFAGVVPNQFLKPYINDLEGDENMHSEVIIVFCLNHVLKCVINPFPGQRRPFHMVPWTSVPGSAFGRGVAQKIFDAQKNVNRLMRMYIDNKRLSGNLMTAIDKGQLRKGETLEIYPGRNWEFEGGFQGSDVSKLLNPIFFPDVTAGVLEAIGTMVQWADESSGIPRILEGQPGTDPSTAFAENQRITAASKKLGLVLKNYDMHAWVPIVESFYDWNMQFLKDKEVKGDFEIIATGFSTFENRQLRKLDLERLLLMSQQLPGLAVKVKSDPIIEDWAVASNIDPERYLLSEVQVADKIKAQQQEQIDVQRAAMELEQQKMNVEHQMEAELKRLEGEMSAQTRLALAQIQTQSKAASDQIKAETQRLMKLADIESKDKDRSNGRRRRGRRQGNTPNEG